MENKDRIRRLRKAKGLTQQEFANKIDVSKQYISQLEHGLYQVSDKVKRRIVKEFALPIDFFESDVVIEEGTVSQNRMGSVVLTPKSISSLNDFIVELHKCNGSVIDKPVSEYYAKLSDWGKLTIDDIIKTMYEREQAEHMRAQEYDSEDELKLVGEDD